MRWLAVAVVAAMACGPKAAEPLEPPNPPGNSAKPRKQTKQSTYIVDVPRPEIDMSPYLPDFHDDLRWPLGGMAHPKLEPAFPIAISLASPGVGWMDLCSMGAQNRHLGRDQELQSYLRGWCRVLKSDVDGACKHLVPLLGSVTRGLATAVRTDLANILVDVRGIDKVEHWLNTHNIRDVATLDLLAASFVELGDVDAAQVINQRALDSDYPAPAATKCHRLVRSIVLAKHNDLAAQKQLESLALAKVPNEVCVELHEAVVCAQKSWCWGYHKRHHIAVEANRLLGIYAQWPHGGVSYHRWYEIGSSAIDTARLHGGGELVVTAFEAALRANEYVCDEEWHETIRRLSWYVKRSPAAAALEPRVSKLVDQCRPRAVTAR